MSGITGIKFRPVMGPEDLIKNAVQSNGYLYVATDSGNMYLDVNNHRISIGGSGGSGGTSAGFVWADGTSESIIKAQPDNDDDYVYYINLDVLEDGIAPKPDNLILNSDGRFFRVQEVDLGEGIVVATLIAVSGTGGGGGGSTERDVSVTYDTSTIGTGKVYVYEQEYYALFTPNNTVGDPECDLIFKFVDRDGNVLNTVYANGVPSGEPYQLNMAEAPLSNELYLLVTVKCPNSQYKNGQGYTPSRIGPLKVITLDISKDNDAYLGLVKPGVSPRSITVNYTPEADSSLQVTQHVYIDNIENMDLKRNLRSDENGNILTVSIPEQSHGAHTIEIAASSIVNGAEIYTKRVGYQAAWAEEGNDTPIIWLGNYDKEIINYENSYIEFMVYDPISAAAGNEAEIHLYKESAEVGQMSFAYSDLGFQKWDISTLYEVGTNNYSIVCRSVKVDILNEVITEGSRDLGLVQQEALHLNFSTAGRSNSEVSSQREIFKDSIYGTQAILTGFNWVNNGWNNDGIVDGIDNGSYLTIANGAKVTIPFPSATLNVADNYSIEMRFRIKNVQKYSTLVKTFAKYFINEANPGDEPIKSSQSYTMAEIKRMEQNLGHSIELYYDEYGSPVMDEKVSKEYEKEEGIVCKWMDGNNGLCIGTQEAYFASPKDIVSVRYKEDEIINISIIISVTDGLSYIYLNGILSGAAPLPEQNAQGQFSINSNFVINSDYCDIDLYRFRLYINRLSPLTMPEVIHNYLSDIHSVKLYDQNQIALSNSGSGATKLSYEKLIEYNNNHPDALTMPYATWKIISDNKKNNYSELLPYYKGNKCICEVNFVNPSLDKALEDGLIDEWYYYTHCPSFRARGVEIDVQGTSSQGYPRRNYKTKFKSAAPSDDHQDYGWFYTKGSLANKRVDKGGTVLQTKNSNGEDLATPVERTINKKFHMDNEELGTNKFTWKIDYMESSGTYNTGYANLMGNLQHPLYTQHPLDFYNINGLNTKGLRTTVYGFPVLTFHEYSNTQMNPSQPGMQYEYIGRYNFNLDKSSNEYYGFEIEKEQPYIDYEWDEMAERDVIDPNTGEPMLDGDGNVITEEYVKAHHMHPWISQISECWELSDNQGTWCSWKYPNEDARRTGFHTLQSGYNDRLECMLHFEYRYSYYGDQLDAIGADGKYDGKQTSRDKYASEIGTTHLDMSNYAYNRYSKLEEVFTWLDSTDQETATNAELNEPLTIQTPKSYNGVGEVSEGVWGYSQAKVYDSSQTYYIQSGGEYTQLNFPHSITDFATDENNHITGFKKNVNYYVRDILYYNTTFSNDSAGYRLEKFRREFNLHLNKEYCLVYYIMTELLLCYDSRGKNMMFATFGPTADSQGNYVWFPMFYDIDTQLGLNNSGAYLWDYDADVSKDGLFSTPTSVLWINLWDAFEEDIKSKYRVLRGADDGTSVVGSLSYENIAGAYTCDATVFDSYAMQGIRPTVAIGLDEYYKYFATTTASGVGYFDTSGVLVKEATPTYAYACQGDKILTTELLLRNRLNYIDSWWMGGDYDITKVKGGELQLRVSGNRATKTSDTYLDSVETPYPIPYYDAIPGYTLKPFLKQYVSYFTDEVPGEPKQYTGEEGQENGVYTNVPASTLTAYRNQPETPNEQLNYIPGLDYLSSLGDLSTSYVSEFSLRKGKRLLDLILGSDAPGYKNQLVTENTIFGLYMAKTDSGKKPLMKKVVLTGLTDLAKAINVNGSSKLQEFRALNTVIPSIELPDGAPLHTLHLPRTISGLSLIKNNELTRILTEEPDVWNAESPDDYKGLYIENLTDATTMGTDHNISTLIIDGGGLGYDAYNLLKKFMLVKTVAANETNANAGPQVKIGMINQQWTPYEQVENGEAYNPNLNYYELNDHNMFDSWTFTNSTDWTEKTLNGTLYTINADKWEQRNTITDLSVFETFLTAYDQAIAAHSKSKWGMMEETALPSVPTISGTIFVNNDSNNLIDEVELTNVYGVRWPNLTVTAAHVRTANITKYVRVYDTGRQETLQILRTGNNTPNIFSASTPTQTYYDFLGWSTTPNYVAPTDQDPTDTLVLRYNSSTNSYDTNSLWNELQFTNEIKTITLYAIFVPHPYNIYFYSDDTLIEDNKVNMIVRYGEHITMPSRIPAKDESQLPDTQKYRFLGYSLTQGGKNVVDLNSINVVKDMTFYPVFSEPVSAYEYPLSNQFLTYEETTYTSQYTGETITGWAVGLQGYYYSGKITIPAEITNTSGITKPVIAIKAGSDEIPTEQNGKQSNNIAFGGFDPGRNSITHIFFEKHGNVEPQLKVIKQDAFRDCITLKYVDFPDSLEVIEKRAFFRTPIENLSNINVLKIDEFAFKESFTDQPIIKTTTFIGIGPRVKYIGRMAFDDIYNVKTIQIGNPDEMSQLDGIDDSNNIAWGKSSIDYKLDNIIIYTNDKTKAVWSRPSFQPANIMNATVSLLP